MTKLEMLIATGEALYGPQWQCAIAHDLGVSDRAVRRWVAGGGISVPDFKRKLYALLQQRSQHIAAIQAKLAFN